jgi:hypothetical protein
MSALPLNPQQIVAQVRPVLERLDQATGSDPFAASSFHRLCTTLGIAHTLRPDLWQLLINRGYVTDAGNGAVSITEEGLLMVSPPRRRS